MPEVFKEAGLYAVNYVDSEKTPNIIEMNPITVNTQPVVTEYFMALSE